MPSNHLVLCCPILFLLSIFPSIRVFSNGSALQIRYWSFSFSISPSNEYSGLISFRIDWFDLLAVQGTLKSLLLTTVQKHQFFGAQPSLWSNSHIHTWLLEKLYYTSKKKIIPFHQIVKNLPTVQETRVWSLGWKIPWRREWLPTPVVLPGESHGQRSLQAVVHGVARSQTWLSD